MAIIHSIKRFFARYELFWKNGGQFEKLDFRLSEPLNGLAGMLVVWISICGVIR